MKKAFLHGAFFSLLSAIGFSCQQQPDTPSTASIKELDLKKGAIISCGPASQQFGTLAFEVSGGKRVQEDFALALKLLHSFEYNEAEKAFAKIIDAQPACAMAYWGVAMSNFHPLWAPPLEPELQKGAKAIRLAKKIQTKTAREADYIDGIAAFYEDWDKVDHRTRSLRFETAMAQLAAKYPTDKEAAIFYALALTAAADPADKTFAKQKKAGAILNALYPGQPHHPGIVHYLIHSYDAPELAELGLPAARAYASVAPSSAHALHMPSHIFTRLGLWNDCIASNRASVYAAQCYAKGAGINGHWAEELHGMDYLMYAYLQTGDTKAAQQQWAFLKAMQNVQPVNLQAAYALAAIPSRYVLENRLWHDAAKLEAQNKNVSWEAFPWQEAIVHFTRLLGAVHTNNIGLAETEWKELEQAYNTLLAQKDAYKANQVAIQMKAGEAWIQFKKGNNQEAVAMMNIAADMEEKTGKHPVTPGEVLPAKELLGDLLMHMNRWDEALEAYEANLKSRPNRFNGLYGAALAAEKTGDNEKANFYYRQLLSIVTKSNASRPELQSARQFLDRQQH